jgi:hypothetical protein
MRLAARFGQKEHVGPSIPSAGGPRGHRLPRPRLGIAGETASPRSGASPAGRRGVATLHRCELGCTEAPFSAVLGLGEPPPMGDGAAPEEAEERAK